jgi:hypothetical protein
MDAAFLMKFIMKLIYDKTQDRKSPGTHFKKKILSFSSYSSFDCSPVLRSASVANDISFGDDYSCSSVNLDNIKETVDLTKDIVDLNVAGQIIIDDSPEDVDLKNLQAISEPKKIDQQQEINYPKPIYQKPNTPVEPLDAHLIPIGAESIKGTLLANCAKAVTSIAKFSGAIDISAGFLFIASAAIGFGQAVKFIRSKASDIKESNKDENISSVRCFYKAVKENIKPLDVVDNALTGAIGSLFLTTGILAVKGATVAMLAAATNIVLIAADVIGLLKFINWKHIGILVRPNRNSEKSKVEQRRDARKNLIDFKTRWGAASAGARVLRVVSLVCILALASNPIGLGIAFGGLAVTSIALFVFTLMENNQNREKDHYEFEDQLISRNKQLHEEKDTVDSGKKMAEKEKRVLEGFLDDERIENNRLQRDLSKQAEELELLQKENDILSKRLPKYQKDYAFLDIAEERLKTKSEISTIEMRALGKYRANIRRLEILDNMKKTRVQERISTLIQNINISINLGC